MSKLSYILNSPVPFQPVQQVFPDSNVRGSKSERGRPQSDRKDQAEVVAQDPKDAQAAEILTTLSEICALSRSASSTTEELAMGKSTASPESPAYNYPCSVDHSDSESDAHSQIGDSGQIMVSNASPDEPSADELYVQIENIRIYVSFNLHKQIFCRPGREVEMLELNPKHLRWFEPVDAVPKASAKTTALVRRLQEAKLQSQVEEQEQAQAEMAQAQVKLAQAQARAKAKAPAKASAKSKATQKRKNTRAEKSSPGSDKRPRRNPAAAIASTTAKATPASSSKPKSRKRKASATDDQTGDDSTPPRKSLKIVSETSILSRDWCRAMKQIPLEEIPVYFPAKSSFVGKVSDKHFEKGTMAAYDPKLAAEYEALAGHPTLSESEQKFIAGCKGKLSEEQYQEIKQRIFACHYWRTMEDGWPHNIESSQQVCKINVNLGSMVHRFFVDTGALCCKPPGLARKPNVHARPQALGRMPPKTG